MPLKTENINNQPMLYMALELSQKKWKIAFGDGKKKSVITIDSGDINRLVTGIEKAKEKFKMADPIRPVSCFEAGRDGFWIHRLLDSLGVENIVVDSSSIEVNRRARRAKNDYLDSVKLLQMLIRHHGDEDNVWSVLNIPSPAEEDERRLHRELERLKKERTAHRNRIRSLLALHGISLKLNAELASRLDSLLLWDGTPFPEDLKNELKREIKRLDLLEEQIKSLEKEQKDRLKSAQTANLQKVAKLVVLCGIGSTSAWVFVMEFLGWRHFNNRREVAAAAGLVPTPYDSGNSVREQGISKAGNRRVRSMIIEIAWCWLRYQPTSDMSLWFHKRFGGGGNRARRVGIVALGRKLLIALWRYLEEGVIPPGAQLKSA